MAPASPPSLPPSLHRTIKCSLTGRKLFYFLYACYQTPRSFTFMHMITHERERERECL
jgi:hypothetical protein